MSRRPFIHSQSPTKGKSRKVLLELGREATNAVLALIEQDSVRRKRHDLGYEIAAYYNRAHNVRVEITRLDRQPFFAPELAQGGE